MTLSALVDAMHRGSGWTPFRPFRRLDNGARCMWCGSRAKPREKRYLSKKIGGGGACILCKGCLERYDKPVATALLRVTARLAVACDRRERAHREAVGWALLDAAHKARGLAETKRMLAAAQLLKVRLVRLDRPPFVDESFLKAMLAPVRQAVAFFVGRIEDAGIEWTHEQAESTTGLGVEISIHAGEVEGDQRKCNGSTEASVKSSTSKPQKKRMRPTSCPLPDVAK